MKSWFWKGIVLLAIVGMLFGKGGEKEGEETVEKARSKTRESVSLEEAGGFSTWKADGFPKAVRTDLVVKLPVADENAIRCYALVKDEDENVIAIMQEDESEIKDWNWWNRMEHTKFDETDAGEVSFKATLVYTGMETEEGYLVFLACDIENYTLAMEGTDDAASMEGNKKGKKKGAGEYVFPKSDKRYLTEEEVRGVDPDKLVLGRNEIFARHGYIFNNQTYQKYFEGISWYEGTVKADDFDSDAVFNKYEKKNVALIKDVENEVNGTSVNHFIGLPGVYECITPRDDFIGMIEFEEPQNGKMKFSIGMLDYPYSLLRGKATILDGSTARIKDRGITITISWLDSENIYVTNEGELDSRDAGAVDAITDDTSYIWSAEFN